MVAKDLRKIGFNVTIKPFEYSAWYESLSTGKFDLSIAWSTKGQSPYSFYKWLASPKTVKPIGKSAAGNWHRFGDSTMDALLKQFEASNEQSAQKRLARQMQKRFVETIPAIPLFPNPSWAECNTQRFVNFPSAANPYAQLSPFAGLERLFVLTEVKPRTVP